ncbi:four-carbon acid sugar kinase family protein [Halalkalicoccus sp. NIPERK01]|uniref:four-carbon acid sugar kinase family protein n=1 Tax=Halalkalicoccus sp. NIPERK01 TaxID=3053469 RepID=UPI00256ECBAE|nr:four-carbon acid sugar kinase family protein [Halalkalicoccus sp. NIPERK01]MDL5362567.1 four-carbon acid sugar kinase family protein [Halalkalicoccus sp. NIPERK01]
MARVLVVADDLTGATDTAHAFAKRGYETAVQVDPDGIPPNATVLAVNTDSRYAGPGTAADRVDQAISRTDASIVYKKIDSTLRGNVESEVEAAMDCGFDRALFAPASPAVGRLTACGYHLVDGRLLTDTEYAEDPNGPTNAHLPALFEGLGRPVGHLGVETVATGSNAVREALANDPSKALVVCDATHDRHLATIARAGGELEGATLYVGSAGLAEYVAVPGDPDGASSHPGAVGDGGALGIVGSVSERSLEQLSALPEEWVLAIGPEALLADPEGAGREAGQQVEKRLADGQHAVATAAPDRAAVERTLELGRDRDLDDEAIRARVARALAYTAHASIEDAAGLFVTGGEVAMAVLGRLEVRALSLSGEEIEAGVPVGRIDGGIADGTPVVTKAGGFGSRETAVNCLRSLGGDHE